LRTTTPVDLIGPQSAVAMKADKPGGK